MLHSDSKEQLCLKMVFYQVAEGSHLPDKTVSSLRERKGEWERKKGEEEERKEGKKTCDYYIVKSLDKAWGSKEHSRRHKGTFEWQTAAIYMRA